METNKKQLSLFDLMVSEMKPDARARRAIITELILKRTELETGARDYARLIVDESETRAIVTQNRGVKTFAHATTKQRVLEARYVASFLDGWKVREKRLVYEVTELERLLGMRD